ncbi:MAG: dTDP-4-dehydrorhamnose reductase [Planctomycetota bacterium]
MSGLPTILLIAPEGMLGTAWCRLLESKGIPYRTASLPEFDITDPNAIKKFVTPDIGVVINCCAYTNVDGAEESEDMATLVNGTGVGYLSEACCQAQALLVHYSTDYVFNGVASEPYKVDGPIEPCNAYGRSKAEGEKEIREHDCPHLILRTSWLYAPWANNFVKTIAKLAKEKESLMVVNDQRGRPTSAEHLAAASLRLIEEGARGTLHVTDGGECTWYDFAKMIAEHANPACKIEPCGSEQYPRPAVRPAYSVMDLGPTEAIIGAMPSWEVNLVLVLDRIAGFSGLTGSSHGR